MLFIEDYYFSPFFMPFSLVNIRFDPTLPLGLVILYRSYDYCLLSDLRLYLFYSASIANFGVWGVFKIIFPLGSVTFGGL
jgi:hypothetical protein